MSCSNNCQCNKNQDRCYYNGINSKKNLILENLKEMDINNYDNDSNESNNV